MRRKVVFLVCTGLGKINRGYESFSRECFDALNDIKDFKLYLIKGGGEKKESEIPILNFHRQSKFTLWLSRLVRKDPYIIEQFTFCFFLLPQIMRKKPAVIYYSDFILGTYLWHLRRLLKFKYKLLFSNGAPNPPPYKTEDHIQQLLPNYVFTGLQAETPEYKQTLLPYGINIDVKENIKRISQTEFLRKKFGLPVNKQIIISVGTINMSHKRMDYVIKEFSKLETDKYFLLLLGQTDKESAEVMDLAQQLLPPESYLIKGVPGKEVNHYMAAADYFILASTNEGLPRVLPEALGNGLLPIVHDYVVTRETLDIYGIFRDLTKQGCLHGALTEVNQKGLTKVNIINYSYKNYSWDNLKMNYKKMIEKVLDDKYTVEGMRKSPNDKANPMARYNNLQASERGDSHSIPFANQH